MKGSPISKKLPLILFFVLFTVAIGVFFLWSKVTPPLKLATATANTTKYASQNWSELTDDLMLYQHFKDFQEDQYFISAQFPLPDFLGGITNFDLYSDYGNQKLKFDLDIGGFHSSLLLSDQCITLETSALSKIYGANLSSFVEDWNDAFFTFKDLPEDTDFNIFQTNLHFSEDLSDIFYTHFSPLMTGIQIEKMDKREVNLPSGRESLETYSVYIPVEDMNFAVDSVLRDVLQNQILLEDLYFYADTFGHFQDIEDASLEDFKLTLIDTATAFKTFYSGTEEGDFSLSMKDQSIVQCTFAKGDKLSFLRFNDLANPIDSMTIHQQMGSEIFTSELILTTEEISLKNYYGNKETFSFVYYPKESSENFSISSELQGISTFSVDAPTAQKVSVSSGNNLTNVGFTSEKQVFSPQWFPQSEGFEPVFELSLFDFLFIVGELNLK